MTSEEWQRVKELFGIVWELPPGWPRRQRLAELCPDTDVCREVERLLRISEDEDDAQFLNERPAAVAGAMLRDKEACTEPLLPAGYLLGNRFRVVRCLGQGGMGDVYEVTDIVNGDQSEALKMIRSDIAKDEEMGAQFRREVALAKKVTDRHVCRIYDLHEDHSKGEPQLFLTMELLPGETLAAHLRTNGRMPDALAVEVGRQLAAALVAAHKAGVIHQDVKSSNVMLVPDPTAKDGAPRAVVMDFGLARSREELQPGRREPLAGTPAYMSPERLAGETSAISDIYALGVVLWEMTTGEQVSRRRPAESGELRAQTALLSKPWWNLIERCISQRPEDRFQTPEEVSAALAELGRQIQQPVKRRRRWTPPWGWRLSGAAAAVLLAGLGAAGWFGLVTGRSQWRPGTNAATLAVMGFQSLSGQPEDAYLSTAFGLGLAEEVVRDTGWRSVPAEEVSRTKTELAVPATNGYTRTTLAQLHLNLGTDLVASGSYLVSSGGRIHLFVQVQDAASGRDVARVSQEGREAGLQELLASTGRELRRQLQLPDTPAGNGQDRGPVLPTNEQAVQRYTEGLQALYQFRPREARQSLQEAVTLEPKYAEAHGVLARVWKELGYDTEAQAEGQQALAFSKDLPEEERLLVQGQAREASHQNAEAAAAYQVLCQRHPRNPDFWLLLAGVQEGTAAMHTLEQLKQNLPAVLQNDPRIDVAEGFAASKASDPQRAQAAARRAERTARARGAYLLLADAKRIEAWAADVLGQPDRATAAWQEARQLYERGGETNASARCLTGLALLEYKRGNLPAAQSGYEAALARFRTLGSQYQIASTINGMAMVKSAEGRWSEAQRLYQESLAISREIKSPLAIGRALTNLGLMNLRRGELANALRDEEESLAVFRSVGARWGQSFALNNLADVLVAQGRLEEAWAAGQKALELAKQVGDPRDIATIQVSLGNVLRAQKKLPAASRMYQHALQAQTGADAQGDLAETLLEQARLALDQHHWRAAEKLAGRSAAAAERLHRQGNLAQAASLRARGFLGQGAASEAEREVERGLRCLPEDQPSLIGLELKMVRTRVKAEQGRLALARKELAELRQEVTRRGIATLRQEAEELTVTLGRAAGSSLAGYPGGRR